MGCLVKLSARHDGQPRLRGWHLCYQSERCLGTRIGKWVHGPFVHAGNRGFTTDGFVIRASGV